MSKSLTNIAASIRRKLLNLSRENREDFQNILTRYGLERLLYRLGNSNYSDRFVLKGAMLFSVWSETVYRPTKDLDLLGYMNDSTEELKSIFRAICQVEAEIDGIIFDPDSLQVEEIRENQRYQGQRVKLRGGLGRTQIDLKIDIGFGDVITPEAMEIEYPTLLELPPPHIRAYPKETVISEKFQTMVALGIINSRMKDFYDLWVISKQFEFKGKILTKAIKATFERRKTAIPNEPVLVFSREFAEDQSKITQWRAFLNKTGLSDEGKGLSGITKELRAFLEPPLWAVKMGISFDRVWMKDGTWQHG